MERMIRIRRLPLFLMLAACMLFCIFSLSAFAESAEPTLSLTVTEASGDAANDLTVIYGDSVTLTVTLSGTDSVQGQTVSLTVGGTTHTLTLDEAGSASLTLPALRLPAKATHTLLATYDSLSAQSALTVQPRTLTLAGMTVADKEYDGSAVAQVSSFGALTGVLEGDDVTPNTDNAVCSFEDQDVGTHKAVFVYLVTLQGSDRLNYSFEAPTLTASILPKKVHIVNVVTAPFAYNGKTDMKIESYTLSGVLESEADAAYLAGIKATTLSPDASPTQGVQFDPQVTYLVGNLAANYELVLPTDVTVEIFPATLTLSVEKVTLNKGQAIPTLTPLVEGFVGGETPDILEGFALPTVTPDAVNTLNTGLTAFTVTFVGGNATANYTFDRLTHTSVDLELRTVSVDATAYAVSADDLSLWHNSAITVTPLGGYVGITTDATDSTASLADIVFLSALLLDGEGENSVTFALRHADGTVTEPVTLSYRLDTVAPTGDVLWREQSILTADTPAYRYFSKSAIALSFTAHDGGSGIAKLEYALSADGPFTEITDFSATLSELGLYGVWYRITDSAGNTTLLCTDGMVLYADTAAADPTLSYQRLSVLSLTLQLQLNGNTPAALCYGDGVPLSAEQFSIDAQGFLTLNAAYLATLAAGEHTLTLSVHPGGQPFAENAVNDAPASLTLTLTVTRRAPAEEDFVLTAPSSTVYDGTEKTVTVTAPAGMGSITVYYVDNAGNRLSVIKNAGTYLIKIDTAVGENYESVSDMTLGTLVIAKMIPAAPLVTFDAATGTLSGETDGLVYAKNDGAFAPLPQSFASVVNGICTLRFYLPGDGLNTEDSEITVISVTRAATPTVVPVAESLFAACDGKLYSTADRLEYRHAGETDWRTVEGTIVTDLAPGRYEIRVRALGTELESSIVEAVITAAPEFLMLEKECTDPSLGRVSLSGELTALSTLTLQGLAGDPASASPMLSLSVIDQRTTQVVRFFQPILEGKHRGTLTLEIAVGEQYDGQTLTVFRACADGSVETLSALCENGVITLNADALSPILITTPMTTPHGTGSTAWIWILVVLGALTVAVCVAIEIKVRRNKKKNEQ